MWQSPQGTMSASLAWTTLHHVEAIWNKGFVLQHCSGWVCGLCAQNWGNKYYSSNPPYSYGILCEVFFFRFLIVIKFIPVLKSDWTVFKCFQTSWIFAKLQLWASMCFSKILLDRAQITKQYPNLWTYHWETFSLSSDTEKEYNQTATFPRHDWQAWKWKFYSEKQ